MKLSIANYPIILSVLSLFMFSCELATLRDPEELKVSFPSTIDEANRFLHDNENRTWKAKAFTLAGLNGFQNCRLDDTMVIFFDGTYEYNGGTQLCGAEDSQRIRKGTWKILEGQRNIAFDQGTANAYMAEIISLESNKIILRSTYFGLEINGTYSSN